MRLPSPRWPASDAASELMPSSRSPSEQMHVDVVSDGLERVVGVEARRHHLRGDAHPDAVRESLSERTGRHFDAGRVAVLGMAGGLRSPLAEALQLIHRHLRIAGEMQQRIEQHRRVAGGEHEAIAILPVRRFRIVAHELGPEDEGHVGHAHRRAGMSRLRLLDAVDGEEADGVDAKLFELVLRPIFGSLWLSASATAALASAAPPVCSSMLPPMRGESGCASGADYIQRVAGDFGGFNNSNSPRVITRFANDKITAW